MITLENKSTLFVDCDDTLVTWNLKDVNSEQELIDIQCGKFTKTCAIYKKNLDVLIEFSTTNAVVVVWSGSGALWAEAVCKALNIEKFVSVCMGKPSFYIDDKECTKWMGKRIYFNLKGEIESEGY